MLEDFRKKKCTGTVIVLVRRSAVLKSLERAMKRPNWSFQKHVKIVFAGEDGEDAGGLTREFFRLVGSSSFITDFIVSSQLLQ